MAARVCVGVIIKPHGVRGAFKIHLLTNDASVLETAKTVYIEHNGAAHRHDVLNTFHAADTLAMSVDGVLTREDAQALKGAKVLIEKMQPEDGDSWYVEDITGCLVIDEAGKSYGNVMEVLFTGANDVYVLEGDPDMLMPALKKLILNVDIPSKRITIRAAVAEEVLMSDED